MATSRRTDRSVGMAILFALLALAGALLTLFGPSQQASAWGFAGAVTAACLVVVALHTGGV